VPPLGEERCLGQCLPDLGLDLGQSEAGPVGDAGPQHQVDVRCLLDPGPGPFAQRLGGQPPRLVDGPVEQDE
jgi:hypothetical protein